MSWENNAPAASPAPLAAVAYAPAADAAYAVSAAALTALDPANLTVPFVVPASGRVTVEFEAMVSGPGELMLGLLPHGGGAVVGSCVQEIFGGPTDVRLHATWILAGLAPGPLQLDIAAFTSGGATAVHAQACPLAASGDPGPAVIVVRAA